MTDAFGRLTALQESQFQTSVDARYEKEHEARLKDLQLSKAKKILDESGIPKKHLKPCELSGEKWLAVSERLNARKGSGFIIALLGDRGCGKTRLAAELAHSMAMLGKSVKYATAMEFFLDIKSTFDHGKVNEKEVIGMYARPSLLILDEMQERGETSWEDRLITHVVDRRYGAEKDTLLISNQTREAFESSVGNSVSSRIVETGGILFCDWASYRVR
jgi:DNA replication protein DnaC